MKSRLLQARVYFAGLNAYASVNNAFDKASAFFKVFKGAQRVNPTCSESDEISDMGMHNMVEDMYLSDDDIVDHDF